MEQQAYILVVDDEGAIRYSITKTLQRVGYHVEAAASGEEALEMMKNQDYDVVLTDIRMPGLTGVELLSKIKEQAPDAVVILLTGYASLETAIESLRLGAHDYLVKPSSSQDIRNSVAKGIERAQNLRNRRALLRSIRENVEQLTGEQIEIEKVEARPAKQPAGSTPVVTPVTTMTIGPLTIYPGRYQISVGDEPIDLTPTEFDLLLYLAAHRGRVVPCSELVREVRGYSLEEHEAREVIRPHVSNLRRKLKSSGQNPNIIVNVRGIGYRLAETS
ncbi:MAG: response regulator transcription factor [Chloroflexota bacterium]|nr:response regulator transcription factor [Anaerolineae bacterium]HMM28666.1 response regulator transcription factor [Aggregatilineaceae bacterium]